MPSTANLNLQRYKVLFICGNYSRILSRLNRNITEMDVRRAFTFFQLMTILEENHHSFLIVEHDPMLYEDAGKNGGVPGPVPQADLQGGHSPALCAAGARSIPACPAKRFILIEDIYFIVLPSEFKRFM